MKCFSLLLAVGYLALAAAQQWQVELVDTSCVPKEVFIRRDSLRTYVAYATAQEGIRIAAKDTAWSYEDMDTGLVRPLFDPTDEFQFHFALGPGGRMAVSGVDDSVRPVVLERSDSGWVRVWTHEMLGTYAPLARAAYCDDSTPAVIYCVQDSLYWSANILVESREDSTWHADTAAHFDPGPPNECELTLYDADCSPEAGPYFLIRFAFWPPEGPTWYGVFEGYPSGSGWTIVNLDGGWEAIVYGYDVAADAGGTVHSAHFFDRYMRFDQERVWLATWPRDIANASIQVDSAGRKQIAFVTRDSVLHFAFKDTRWHFYEVPGVTTATCCDLELDDAGQPLIAFEDAGGLSLAHGIDVVGMEDGPKLQAKSRKLEPTILSGASGVRSLESCIVFDAMGRRVTNPRSGVYFLRPASNVKRDASSVTKVAVAR